MADQVFIDCVDCLDEKEAGTRKRVNRVRFGCGCDSNAADEDHFVCGEHREGHPGSYPLRDGGNLAKGALAPRHEMKCCGATVPAPDEDAPCPNCGAV